MTYRPADYLSARSRPQQMTQGQSCENQSPSCYGSTSIWSIGQNPHITTAPSSSSSPCLVTLPPYTLPHSPSMSPGPVSKSLVMLIQSLDDGHSLVLVSRDRLRQHHPLPVQPDSLTQSQSPPTFRLIFLNNSIPRLDQVSRKHLDWVLMRHTSATLLLFYLSHYVAFLDFCQFFQNTRVKYL